MVSDIITINSGGTFRSALTGNVTTHELNIAGSIVNKGTLNFSANDNAAGVGITFTGVENEVFDLSGAALTNLRQINGVVLNKGTSATSILWFTPGGTFQVISGTNPTVGFLTITSGTYGINGINAFSDQLFYASTGSYTIPPAGGFRLDNPNAIIVGMYGTLTNEGEVIIRDGVYNIGTGTGNESLTNSTGRFEMSGGTMNISGRFRISDGNCILTGGTINLATIGHADRTLAAFYASPSAYLNISDDPLITFAYPNSNGNPYNDIEILAGTGEKTITGGTFQMGTAATPATRPFLVNSEIPIHNLVVYNSNTRVSLTGNLAINNQLTLNGRLSINNFNLNVGAPGIVGTFGVNAGMIVTGYGIGEVRKTISAAGSYLFPVGNVGTLNRYLPVTLNFTDGTFTSGATASVSMVRGKHPQNLNTTNYLTRYWTVGTTGITNPVYDFTGSYYSTEYVGDETSIVTGVYATAWEKLNPILYGPNIIAATGLRGNVAITGINMAAPVVTITNGESVIICNGGSAILTTSVVGDPPFTYIWTPTTGTPTSANTVASPAVTTTYRVTVTDGNGDTGFDEIIVKVNPEPTLTGATQSVPVCEENQAAIQLTGLLANTTFSVTYTINGGGSVTVPGLNADESGTSNFTTVGLTEANDGQTLQITGITITSATPNCSQAFTQDITLIVNNPLVFASCPAAPISLNTLNGVCSAISNYSVIASGTPGPTYSYAFTGATSGSGIGTGSGSSFNLGTTRVMVTATNICGSIGCNFDVVVVDNEPPTFTPPPPFEFCVENLISATHIVSADPRDNLQINPNPDYYLFRAGSPIFDLDPQVLVNNFNDNCCENGDLVIHWRMDFVDTPDPANQPQGVLTHPSIPDQTGQPALYGADIHIPGDGVTFSNAIHSIFYWLEDCNGNLSAEIEVLITITPRPNIIKMN